MHELRFPGLTPIDDHLQYRFLDAEIGPGGAPSHYEVYITRETYVRRVPTDEVFVEKAEEILAKIDFQKGPPRRGDDLTINGVTNETLLAIVEHRLHSFQLGQFPHPSNEEAIGHIRKAIEALQNRTKERVERNVEGQTVE